MTGREDLGESLADNGAGLVGGILGQELGEFGVGGEGWLNGNDHVGGEVGDAGDFEGMSVQRIGALVTRPKAREGANECLPASPAVKMEAMLAEKKPIYPRCWP